jgi:hypothetical protein
VAQSRKAQARDDLTETQFGDVRRRDHIRAFFADPENPRHSPLRGAPE